MKWVSASMTRGPSPLLGTQASRVGQLPAARLDLAPAQGRRELGEITHREGIEAAEPDVPGRGSIGRQVAGSEDDVPQDQVLPVVGVALLDQPRMMPAVKLGHAEEVVERTEAKLQVGVLKDAVDRRDQCEERQHLDAASKQHEQPIGRNEGQQGIDGMKATGVEPVEAWCTVVCRVNAP